MKAFQPTQSEKIILDSDVEEYVLKFMTKPSALIVQVRDKNGVEKNVKVVDETISSNTKTILKAGDIITYIAIM